MLYELEFTNLCMIETFYLEIIQHVQVMKHVSDGKFKFALIHTYCTDTV